MDKNTYYYNYEEDLVVREDENGERYVKTLNNLTERHDKEKTSKAVWGIPSYGIMNLLFHISEKQYNEFGLTWRELNPENLRSIYEI